MFLRDSTRHQFARPPAGVARICWLSPARLATGDMDTRRRLSATRFVVYFQDADAGRKHKAAIPDCEELRPLEHDESVQLLSIAVTQRDPRELWDRVRAALPEAVIVPVLVDRHNNCLYPTGTIQIRFSERPTDDELDSLASMHGLTGVIRNRYQPRQVSCRPADPTDLYLPDVVDEVAGARGVRSAWAETKTAYERS